jgi:polyisoprenoid-binding protein YceI
MLGTIFTAQAQQKLLPQSEISFVSKQMGVPVEGKFTKFDAQLAFDPKKTRNQQSQLYGGLDQCKPG